MEYQYPVDYTWSTDEIVDVIHFFEAIEKAYESKIKKEDVMRAYRRFKEIVPGKADEKTIPMNFKQAVAILRILLLKRLKRQKMVTGFK